MRARGTSSPPVALLAAAIALASPTRPVDAADARPPDVLFVATPPHVVERMLDLARVGEGARPSWTIS